MSDSYLYYNTAKPLAISAFDKLTVVVPTTNNSDVRARLELQYAYNKHTSFWKRFLRNPYTVKNQVDVWECDLLDVNSLEIYNDVRSYILSVIDVSFETSASGPRKDKLRPVHRLCVSVHISRRRFAPSCMGS